MTSIHPGRAYFALPFPCPVLSTTMNRFEKLVYIGKHRKKLTVASDVDEFASSDNVVMTFVKHCARGGTSGLDGRFPFLGPC